MRLTFRVAGGPRRAPAGLLARAGIVLGLLVIAGQLPPAGPAAASATVSNPVAVSGPDPLSLTCNLNPTVKDWAHEPSIAVNPTNHKNLVTAWIQDDSDGIVVGTSMDGGDSWSTVVPPQKFCTGGPPEAQAFFSAYDPWVSFGPDGAAYLASTLAQGYVGAAIVNVSHDGGQTWSAPAFVDRVGALFDRTTMTADPVVAGRAYVAWEKAADSTSPSRPYISATVDAGATWSPPTLIYGPPIGSWAAINQVLVLPDHSLLAVLCQFPNPKTPPVPGAVMTLMSTRSTDHGAHWSTPTTIAAKTIADPTQPVFSSAGIAKDGTLYVAWQRPNSNDLSILYSKSSDGGGTWQTPGVVASLPGPKDQTPSLARILR